MLVCFDKIFQPIKWSIRFLNVVAYETTMAQVLEIVKLHTSPQFLSIITFQIRFVTVVYATEKK